MGALNIDPIEQRRISVVNKINQYSSSDKAAFSSVLDRASRALDAASEINQKLIQNTANLKGQTEPKDMKDLLKTYEDLDLQLGDGRQQAKGPTVFKDFREIINSTTGRDEEMNYLLGDPSSEINKVHNGVTQVEDALRAWQKIPKRTKDQMNLITLPATTLEPINDLFSNWISERRRRINGVRTLLQ
jgi:hypothetical protein